MAQEPQARTDDLSRQLAGLARKAEDAARRRPGQPLPRASSPQPRYAPRARIVARISQLYHGELMTAQVCRALARQVSLPEARHCLALQGDDELAHAALYAGYLRDLEGLAPRRSVLALLQRETARWRGPPEALMLAVHVLLEGEAATLQRSAALWLPCPRFQAMSQEIARDEARHIAFGRLYLPPALAALSRRERLAIHAWLRDLWLEAVARIKDDRDMTPLAARPLFRAWARRRWRHWQGELMRIGLTGGDNLGGDDLAALKAV